MRDTIERDLAVAESRLEMASHRITEFEQVSICAGAVVDAWLSLPNDVRHDLNVNHAPFVTAMQRLISAQGGLT